MRGRNGYGRPSRLYALAVLSGRRPDQDGEAEWRLLDVTDAAVDADAAAEDVEATPFNQPSDVAAYTSLLDDGSTRNTVFVTVRGEDRVLALALRAGNEVFASAYVDPGLNAPDGFQAPYDVTIDALANLHIGERNPGSASLGKTLGDDIWVATPSFTSGARADR